MEKALSIKKIISKLPVLSFDILSIPLSWYLAHWLQNNLRPLPHEFGTPDSLIALEFLLVIQIACYYHFKVYRGLWKFSSLNDVARIIRAVICSICIVLPILYMTKVLPEIPRSIFPLYSMVIVTLLCGARLICRSYAEFSNQLQTSEQQKVLIIGAGRAGESLIRELKRNSLYIPIAIVDDDENKQDLEVHGVPVKGKIFEIDIICKKYNIDLILIAMPSIRSAEMRYIVNQCEKCKIPFRILPSINAVAAGRVEVNSFREVRLEDLLGRDQVEINWNKIESSIKDKKILITGAGGSIGAELCRQIIKLKPQKLFLLDNSEFNLYKIDLELRKYFPDTVIEIALVNVTDQIAVETIFQKFQPQVVFHAAAYKHVPLLENQIRAAMQNNVIGTKIVAQVSVLYHVEKFILISTDKAVNPTNIMGASKRAAEVYCQNLNQRVNTQFITVRFGNVLGSVGSVVPLFQQQLKNGGPITVTHPDMQRYFMTIPEASQLILQAMVNGSGGEIFVLDMGEPIKISYLAEQMIRLAGKEPGKDIEIEYTGLRPGEKLFEELFHGSEELVNTAHEKLFMAKFRKIDWEELTQTIRLINNACDRHHDEELYILLKSLVPEYQVPLIHSTRLGNMAEN